MAAPPAPPPQPIGNPAAGIAVGPPTASAAWAIIVKLQDSLKQAVSQQRPWQELVDRNSFAKPDNLNEATNRVKKNLAYFRANYATVILTVVVLSMLMSPMSIFWLVLLALAWGYVFMFRTDPTVIMGRILNDREKFLGLTAVTVLIVFGLTRVGSILMSGVIIGAVAVIAHAAFRVPDDLFLDEPDAGGFLSWLGGGQTNGQLPASIGHV